MKKGYKNADAFFKDMIHGNVALADEDEFEFDLIKRHKKEIFEEWQFRVANGQDEWCAVEASVRHILNIP